MKKTSLPPVWMMVKEAHAALGNDTTRRAILHWVLKKYPGTKANTIGCQTTICTVNNPVRVQFVQNAKPRTALNQYDFLFRTSDGRLVRYSPKKHGHWIIRANGSGSLSIRCVSEPKSKAPPNPKLHIFFCGAPEENKDYAALSKLAANGRTTKWSSLKKAYAGDRVLFYTVQARRAFMASGWILQDTKLTNDPDDYRYRAKIGAVRLLSSPVPISLVKQNFPDWGWPRYTRNITTVPQKIAPLLWSLVHKAGGSAAAPAPAGPGGAQARNKIGAGFGTSKENKLVEAAAIKAVSRHLKSKKYKVRSRESDKIGYDLDARRGTEVMHAEVKGISGEGLSFIITQNEVATARIDPVLKLFVVNKARTTKPVIREFKGGDVDKKFNLTAISYRADER